MGEKGTKTEGMSKRRQSTSGDADEQRAAPRRRLNPQEEVVADEDVDLDAEAKASATGRAHVPTSNWPELYARASELRALRRGSRPLLVRFHGRTWPLSFAEPWTQTFLDIKFSGPTTGVAGAEVREPCLELRVHRNQMPSLEWIRNLPHCGLGGGGGTEMVLLADALLAWLGASSSSVWDNADFSCRTPGGGMRRTYRAIVHRALVDGKGSWYENFGYRHQPRIEPRQLASLSVAEAIRSVDRVLGRLNGFFGGTHDWAACTTVSTDRDGLKLAETFLPDPDKLTRLRSVLVGSALDDTQLTAEQDLDSEQTRDDEEHEALLEGLDAKIEHVADLSQAGDRTRDSEDDESGPGSALALAKQEELADEERRLRTLRRQETDAHARRRVERLAPYALRSQTTLGELATRLYQSDCSGYAALLHDMFEQEAFSVATRCADGRTVYQPSDLSWMPVYLDMLRAARRLVRVAPP